MQNSVIQAAVRYLTGNAGQFNEDLHALADMLGVSPGTAEARLAAVLSLPPANVYAALGECGDGVFEGMVAGAVLKKYGASLILPGADGATVSSFHTGNFTESTGQTYAAIDGLVGLGLDAAGSLGPELVTNGTFDGNVTSWTGINATLSHLSGSCVITADGVGQARASQTISTVAGRWYEARATIARGTGAFTADLLIAGIALSATVSSTTPTDVVVRFAATASTTTVRVGSSGTAIAGTTYYVDNISVRELTGIHASQATQGYKPTLRRGIVNLLTYSNDFSQAVWVAGNAATKSGNTLSLPAESSQVSHANTISSGVHTFAAILSGSGTVSLIGWNATDGYHGRSQITLTATPTLYVAQVAPSVVNDSVSIRRWTGDTATSVVFGGAGLFQGSYTAQQILDAGGIPLTTNAAASSANGKFWWQFDGIDDKLTMTFPAGWESATIIDARATGQVTQSGQNIVGTYNVQTSTYGRIFCRLAPSASDLALLQKFANILAGV